MAEGDDQESKTEHPTGKRLGEARSKGQLPISRDLSAWVTFAGILVVVGWIGPAAIVDLMSVLRMFLESPDAIRLNEHSLQTLLLHLAMQVGVTVGLIYLVMFAVSILGVMSQTGLFYSLELIKPDFMKLNFIQGYKKLFSANAVVDLVKSFAKLIVLGGAAYYTLMPIVTILPSFTGLPLVATMLFFHQQAVHLIIILLLLFSLIAAGDKLWQNYHYIKSLKMTKQEVKDEHRQQEGDPIVKRRLAQLRMDKARKRMMAQVPKADVVITNPTHYALALQYDNKKMGAPLLLAKGIDRIAERIREVAEENRIPLVSNPPLARALYDTVEIDQEIPTQHYRAVAEVISYVYKLKNRKL